MANDSSEFNLVNVTNGIEDLHRLRKALLIWALIGIVYVTASNPLIPLELRYNFVVLQLLTKLPPSIILFAASYHPRFKRHLHPALFTTMLLLTFSDLFLMAYLWEAGSYVYGYECIVFEICFALFIVVLNYRYAYIYSAISLAGLAYVLYNYPLYGADSPVRMATALMISGAALVGRYRMEKALTRINNTNLKLLDVSQHDNLTRLLNRTPFNQRFERLLSNATISPTPIAVYMIDVDNFKRLNDTHGHPLGDQLLARIADMLNTVFKRKDDIIGRFGGDEYIAVTSNITKDLAYDMGQKILSAARIIDLQSIKGESPINISLSVGICWATPTEHDTIQLFIKKADTALYQAKASGRNTVRLYNKSDTHI